MRVYLVIGLVLANGCGEQPRTESPVDAGLPAGLDAGRKGPCANWSEWDCSPAEENTCFAFCTTDPDHCVGCTERCYKCVVGTPMQGCPSSFGDLSGCERCRATVAGRCW